MTKHWTSILLVAATYVGTVVGAGFATGKEIVTFFSVHGAFGVIGIALSGFLFMMVGTKIMLISKRIKAYSYQDLNRYLFGDRVGKLVNIFMLIIVIGVTSVMLSGAGAVFREQMGLPFQLGIGVTLVVSYIVVLRGLKGIFAINAYIVPLMILYSLFVFISIFTAQPLEIIGQLRFDFQWDNLAWMLSPFTYSAFNLMTAMVVLVPMGNEIQDEHVLKWGGFIGGLILTAILMMNHFSLSVFPNSFLFDIPMGEIVKLFGVFIHILFLFVIYGEIFNTVVGNVFGITRQLTETFHLSYHHAVFLIMLVIYMISQAGYGKLITILYPLFGYLSLFMLVLLLVKKMPVNQ